MLTNLHELIRRQSQLVKIGMKRKESETQDSTRLIVGDNLLTVSEGVSVKLNSQAHISGRARILAAPAQPLTLEELIIPPDYQSIIRGKTSFFTNQRECSYSGRKATSRCWKHSSTGLQMGQSRTAPEIGLSSTCPHRWT